MSTARYVLLHYSRCSKSRAAVAYLAERGITAETRLYLEDPLTAAELADLCSAADLEPHELVRSGEPVYQELGLSPQSSEQELYDALAAHPILLERPILLRYGPGDCSPAAAAIGRPTQALDSVIC